MAKSTDKVQLLSVESFPTAKGRDRERWRERERETEAERSEADRKRERGNKHSPAGAATPARAGFEFCEVAKQK